MTIFDLNREMTVLLKKYIIDAPHVDTGALLQSIKFVCKEDSNGLVEVSLRTEEYLQYLERGAFIEDFFKSKDFERILEKYYSELFSI